MKPSAEDDCLWTLGDVARYLRCTTRHVQNLVTCGLPHIKVGRLIRFCPDEVRSYLLKERAVGGR